MNTELLVKLHFPVIAPLLMCPGLGDGKATSCLLAQTHTIAELARGRVLQVLSDRDEGVCPVLRKLGIRANDAEWWASNEERTECLRPFIPILLDSRGSASLTLKRGFFTVDNAVRVVTPMRLEWIAEHIKDEKLKAAILDGAACLRALATIMDKPTAELARIACSKLRYADADADAAYTYAHAHAATYADASYTHTHTSHAAATYADADADVQQKLKYRTVYLSMFRECAALME